MKILRVLLIAILISLVGYPAYSQEHLVLYDNFEGESIDLNRWQPISVSREILDVKRFIEGKRLHLMERHHGGTDYNSSPIPTRIRLAFPNPLVTAIQAKFKVKAVEVVGCNSSSQVSVMRAGRLSGTFFSTTGEGPGVIDEVFAAIEIRRDSDSLDPDGMLRVRGNVFLCTDLECLEGVTLGIADLGTTMVGQWATLLIQWEPDYAEDDATGAFIFQHDNGPEVTVAYFVSDDYLSNSPLKRIGISAFVPNCTTEPRPVGYAEVEIKDVFVNASAFE